jgi:type II secretory pathway component GspD/PulD (secretin)
MSTREEWDIRTGGGFSAMENKLSRRVSKAAWLISIGCIIGLIIACPVLAQDEPALSPEQSAEYQSYMAKGTRHFEQGRYHDAISEFNRALLLKPDSREAKRAIIKASREIAARSDVPDIEAIEKDRLDFHLTKGTEYYDKEKYDEAIAEWQEALRIDPDNKLAQSLIEAGKRAKVDVLMEKGHDEFFAGRIDEAIAIWEEAHEITPSSRVLDELIAEAHRARHEREQARIGADIEQQYQQMNEFVAKQGLLPEEASPDGMKRRDLSEKPAPRKIKEFGAREAIMKELSQPVAFEFECEPLRDVLRFLTTITGINILIDEEIFNLYGSYRDCYDNTVDRLEIFVTIHVSDLPLESALNGMLRQHGLGFSIERDFIYISTPDILRGSSFEQLETRFYHLKDSSRVSLPKLEPSGKTKGARIGGGQALDLLTGSGITSNVKEIKGNKSMEVDPDYTSMSVPMLVNLLRTFIPTVLDPSKSAGGGTGKVGKDKLFGGLSRGTDQLRLFEDTRKRYSDASNREILSLIEYDPHTNILIVRNTPSNLETLEVFLDHLDPEPRQVAVEAKFITYSLLEAEKVGVSVQLGGEDEDGTIQHDTDTLSDGSRINWKLDSSIAEEITGDLLGRGGEVLFRFTKADGEFLNATIDLLSELKNTQTISAPRIVTMHNKPAVIQDVTTSSFRSNIEITSRVSGTGGTAITTSDVVQEFTDVTEGITLSITPQIQPDNTIRLFILPDVTDIPSTDVFPVSSSSGVEGEQEEVVNTVTRPVVVRQSLFTNVIVNDGDTIVIGGLIRNDSRMQTTGIPFLKDIPLVGRAFENETKYSDRTNLLIFITVNIMDTHGVAYTRLM